MTALISIDIKNGIANVYQDRGSFDREREQIARDDEALIFKLNDQFGYTQRAAVEYNKQSRRVARLSDLKERLARHIDFEYRRGD
jgi:hypothetical protein